MRATRCRWSLRMAVSSLFSYLPTFLSLFVHSRTGLALWHFDTPSIPPLLRCLNYPLFSPI